MNEIDALVTLVPPPQHPLDGDGAWPAVEAALGTALPEDFRDLIRRYGTGSLCDEIFWHSPFSTGHGMIQVAQQRLALDRAGREVAPEAFLYPLHPELGGVLPWATTADRPALYWLTGEDPDDWPVVVAEWGTRIVTYDLSATAFLRAWSSGELDCPVIGRWSEQGLPPYFRQPSVPLDGWYVELAPTDKGVKERVREVKKVFAPTRARRRSIVDEGVSAELHLYGTDAAWELEYRTVRLGPGPPAPFGQNVQVWFRPEERDAARQVLVRLARALDSPATTVATSSARGTWVEISDLDGWR